MQCNVLSEWGSGGEGIRRGLPFTAKYAAADDGDGEAEENMSEGVKSTLLMMTKSKEYCAFLLQVLLGLSEGRRAG